MPSAKEEAFGAAAALIRGESLDQAIDWINTKTNLGHSACIMTQSGKHARKFIREVNVGNVGVKPGRGRSRTAFFPPGSAARASLCGNAKSRLASMKLFMDEKDRDGEVDINAIGVRKGAYSESEVSQPDEQHVNRSHFSVDIVNAKIVDNIQKTTLPIRRSCSGFKPPAAPARPQAKTGA